jgi:hypothetical protein
MTTYKVVPDQGGSGYNAELVSDNGAHQTMLGFATVVAAERWIESDRQRDRDAGPPPPVSRAL